jgi:hypothetical protein
MTISKRTVGLDEVLADYAHASQDFDAKVLQAFIEEYPEHARALQRYAQIQLTSVPATPEEVDSESLSDEELLPMQSKLLQRMHELRGSPSAADSTEAARRLASISGDAATRAAAIAVFGSCAEGEDLLLVSITDSSSDIGGVPPWFYEGLGSHIGVPGAAVRVSLALKRQPAGLQRHSSKGKPVEAASTTWTQLVEECISDDGVKRAIMKRTGTS